MGFADIFRKSSNETTISLYNEMEKATSGLVRASGENPSVAITVDEDTAMKIASLNQGINIIADTIASMPVYLHKDTEGFQETLFEDPRCKILSGMANEVLTSFNLKKNMIKDLILYGNSYAKIVREGENVKLYYLPTNVVTPKKDTSGYYFEVKAFSTDVMGEKNPSEVVDFFDMLVLIRNPKYNSITGVGLLEHASDTINMASHETNYMINLFRNGLSAKAVLTSKTPFKREIKDQLKRDLQEFYSGYANAGKMMVLEGDIDVLPLNLTPSDIRLIDNKNLTITEIARFLNIQKHLLNLDRGQGTYSNITQERLMLLQNTLTPYCVAIEEALNSKLLTEEEIAQGYYFQFNTEDMLKLTPEDNAKYMLSLYEQNIVTLEEVRATLNLGGNTDVIKELKMYQELKIQKVSKEASTIGEAEVTNEENVEDSTKEKASEKEATPKDDEKSEKA